MTRTDELGTPEPLRVTVSALATYARDILMAAGLSAEHASTVADCLIYADLAGVDSHGVSRLPIYARRIHEGIVNANARPRVVSAEMLALRVIDGDNAPGAVVGAFAMREAVAAAKSFGVGFSIAHASNHFGVAAYYARLAAAQGSLGICGTNAPINMAVWGSREPALGTNPLAMAAPAGRYGELNLDMSSSTVAKGKVLVHARKGLPIPEGWALDTEGNPTTDAAAAVAGVVLPFAGPKGSGLSLFIDLIAGVMSGAAFGAAVRDQYTDFKTPQNVGHFFIAVDISQIMPLEAYSTRVEAFCDELKAKQLAPGIAEIRLPGEAKARSERERRGTGIDIDATLEKELDALAGKLQRSTLRSRAGRS
jgi:LDH2 family malate/lactate/ureidoglycolate dehydrogenase